jgi:Raf kinase inhibitor-like YbhB/YbcL family protein
MAELALESEAFERAQAIPNRYTCDGEDLSPPLRWANAPDQARSLALLVDDPDAPRGVLTHWVAWGLIHARAGCARGEAAPGERRNDFGTLDYRGPCPPPGTGAEGGVSLRCSSVRGRGGLRWPTRCEASSTTT